MVILAARSVAHAKLSPHEQFAFGKTPFTLEPEAGMTLALEAGA